jgi:hypothetical protein
MIGLLLVLGVLDAYAKQRGVPVEELWMTTCSCTGDSSSSEDLADAVSSHIVEEVVEYNGGDDDNRDSENLHQRDNDLCATSGGWPCYDEHCVSNSGIASTSHND